MLYTFSSFFVFFFLFLFLSSLSSSPSPPLSLSLISRSIHAYPRLVSTLVRPPHTRDNKRMRSTIQNGILSAKIENINFDSATRHAFSFNGVQCNAIYRGKQRTIKSPLWKILALLASELYRLTTKTYFVSKPRNR